MQDFIPVYNNKQTLAKYIDDPVSPANDIRFFSVDVVLCSRFLPLFICFDRLSIRHSWPFPLFWYLITTSFYALLYSLVKRIFSLASPLSIFTLWVTRSWCYSPEESAAGSCFAMLRHRLPPARPAEVCCATEGAGSLTWVKVNAMSPYGAGGALRLVGQLLCPWGSQCRVKPLQGTSMGGSMVWGHGV